MKSAINIKAPAAHERGLEIWSPSEREAFLWPRQVSVAQAAASDRYISAGKIYDPALTPYMAGPMEAFADPEVEWLIVMAAVQIGKTTAEENMLAYAIEYDPGDTLIICPRDEDIGYNQMRIRDMIEASPVLLKHAGTSPRNLEGVWFELDNMRIFFSSAGSAAGLAQKTIRYVFFGEVDKYPPFSGRESSPIELGEKRGTWMEDWEGKYIMSCTPTTEDNFIYLAFADSNMQEYYVPCPRCGGYQFLKFGQLKLPESLRDPEEIIEKNDCWYECEHCGKKIIEDEKPRISREGIWAPQGQYVNANGRLMGTALRGKRRSGFHVPGLLSQAPKMRWSRILARWFKANQAGADKQKLMMAVRNNDEGLPYKMTGRQIKAEQVAKGEGSYRQGTVPARVILLTAFGDYHKSLSTGTVRIRWGIRGWTAGPEFASYLIDCGEAAGTGDNKAFEELDKALFERRFPVLNEEGKETGKDMGVGIALIDSGWWGKKKYTGEDDI
jgi:phage terminase large subunit GpA-like protein